MTARIEWLRADDLASLQAYVNEHWQPDHVFVREPNLLRWQYRHPDPDLLSVLVARDDGALLGILGLVQTPFAWYGQPLSAAWLAMWSVVPEARRRGVGLALLVEAMRQFEVIACLGFNEAAERIYRGLGFEVRPALPRWVTAVDIDAYERLLGLRPAAVGRISTEAPAAGALEEDLAERWEARWREHASNLVGSARDLAFLRWRYVEHPSFRYVIRMSADAGAVCVYRLEPVKHSNERVLRIVELLGDQEPAAELVSSALTEATDVALADFFCASPEFAAPLARLGFTRVEDHAAIPDGFQPLKRSHGLRAAFWRRGGGGDAFVGTRLYVTRADGDQDRPR